MQKFIIDKTNGITYELIGEQYYPRFDDPITAELGYYGRMRKTYLMVHIPELYNQLQTSGELVDHLKSIDKEAEEMQELLIKQMAKAQGVTEQLKADDMMKWVGLMNNIRNATREIVLTEVVYVH